MKNSFIFLVFFFAFLVESSTFAMGKRVRDKYPGLQTCYALKDAILSGNSEKASSLFTPEFKSQNEGVEKIDFYLKKPSAFDRMFVNKEYQSRPPILGEKARFIVRESSPESLLVNVIENGEEDQPVTRGVRQILVSKTEAGWLISDLKFPAITEP